VGNVCLSRFIHIHASMYNLKICMLLRHKALGEVAHVGRTQVKKIVQFTWEIRAETLHSPRYARTVCAKLDWMVVKKEVSQILAKI
jgi:hypothetical protein